MMGAEYLSLAEKKRWDCNFLFFSFEDTDLGSFLELRGERERKKKNVCVRERERKKKKVAAIKGIRQEQPSASTTNEQLQCENTFKVLNELSLW